MPTEEIPSFTDTFGYEQEPEVTPTDEVPSFEDTFGYTPEEPNDVIDSTEEPNDVLDFVEPPVIADEGVPSFEDTFGYAEEPDPTGSTPEYQEWVKQIKEAPVRPEWAVTTESNAADERWKTAYDTSLAQARNISDRQKQLIFQYTPEDTRRKGDNDGVFGEKGFFGNIKTKAERAELNAVNSTRFFDAMIGLDNVDEVMRSKKELDLVEQEDPVKSDNFLSWMAQLTTEVLPAMATGIAQGTVGQVAGVPAPVGTGQYWYRQGAGQMYGAMLELGVDEPIARGVGFGAGVPYAALEFLQVSKIAPWLKESSTAVVAKTTKEVAKEFAKEYGKDWAKEVGQEVMQEFTQVVAEETGKALTNHFNTDKKLQKTSWGSTFSRLWETTYTTFAAMPLILLPGKYHGASRNRRIQKEYTATVEANPEIDPSVIEKGLELKHTDVMGVPEEEVDTLLIKHGVPLKGSETLEEKRGALSDVRSVYLNETLPEVGLAIDRSDEESEYSLPPREQLTEEERKVVAPEVALDDRAQTALTPLVGTVLSEEDADVLLETISKEEIQALESVKGDPKAEAEVVQEMIEIRTQVAEEVAPVEEEFIDELPQGEDALRSQVAETLGDTETVTMETSKEVAEEPVIEPEVVTMETKEKLTDPDTVSIVRPKKPVTMETKEAPVKVVKETTKKEVKKDVKAKPVKVETVVAPKVRPTPIEEKRAIDVGRREAVYQASEKLGIPVKQNRIKQESKHVTWKKVNKMAEDSGTEIVAIQTVVTKDGTRVNGFYNNGKVFASTVEAAYHEIFHNNVRKGDKQTAELIERVDTETEEFQNYKELYRPLYPKLSDAALDKVVREEIAADLYSGQAKTNKPLTALLKQAEVPADLDKPGKATDVTVPKAEADAGWRINKSKGGFDVMPPKGDSWSVTDAEAALESLEKHKNDAEYQLDEDVPFSVEKKSKSFSEQVADLNKKVDAGELSVEELGTAIKNIKTDEGVVKEKSSPEEIEDLAELKDLIETEDWGPLDIMNEVERISDNKVLLDAIEKYKEAYTVDKEEYGQRSDLPQSAEENFMSLFNEVVSGEGDIRFSVESKIQEDIVANDKKIVEAKKKLAKERSAKTVTSTTPITLKDSRDPNKTYKVPADEFWRVRRPGRVADAVSDLRHYTMMKAWLQEKLEAAPEVTPEKVIETATKEQLDFLFSAVGIETPSGILTPSKRDSFKNKVRRARDKNPEVFNEKLNEALGKLNEHMKTRDKDFKALETKYRKAKAKNDQKALDALWTEDQIDTLEKFYSLLPSYSREKFKKMARTKVLGAAKSETKSKYMDDIMRQVADRYEKLREKSVLSDIDKVLRKSKSTMKKQNVSYDAWKYFDFVRQALGKRNSKSSTLKLAPTQDENNLRLEELSTKDAERGLTPNETMELTVLSHASTIEGLESLLSEMKETRLKGRLEFMEADLARRSADSERAEGVAEIVTKGKGVLSPQDNQRVERKYFKRVLDAWATGRGEGLGRSLSLVPLLNIAVDEGLKTDSGLYKSKFSRWATEKLVKAKGREIVMEEENTKLTKDKLIGLYGSVSKAQTAARKNRTIDYANETMIPNTLPYLERKMDALDEKIESVENPEAYVEAKAELQQEIDFATNNKQAPLPLSQNKAYKLWQLWQDESTHDHMERNGYDAEFIGNVEKFLKPEVREWAQWQLDVLFPKLWADQNPMHKKMFHMDLANIPNYSPMVFHQGGESVNVGELLNEGEAVPTTIHGALNARVQHTRAIRLVDGDVVLERALAEGTHFAAWADTIRDLRSTFGNSTLKTAFEQQGMTGILKFINRNIDESASTKPLKEVWKKLDAMRKAFVIAKLALNITLYPKQLVSSLAVVAKVNLWELGKSLKEGHYVRDWKEFLAHSPLIRERYAKGYDRDLKAGQNELAQSALTGKINQYYKKLSDASTKIAKIGDLHGLALAAVPYYKMQKRNYLKEGMKPSEAIKHAALDTEVFSNLWQQSAEKMFMNDIQKGGSLAKWVTVFQSSQISYINQIVSSLISIKRNALKGRLEYGDVATILIANWVMPALFSFMRNGFSWDDEELDQILKFGVFSQLGFVGDTLNKAHGYMYNEGKETGFPRRASPILSVTDQALRGVKDLYTDKTGSGINNLANAVNDVTLGLPYDAFEKTIKNWKEFTEESHVKGFKDAAMSTDTLLRFLTYSPYIIKKQHERSQQRVIAAARAQYEKNKPQIEKERAELKKKMIELQELLKD